MKPRILFVDDERPILEGYRTALRKQRKRWDMAFADSGAAALEMLEERPVAVLVTDMRMPGMDGATLLNEVGERWPDTLRIILSGYSEQEMILRVVKAAHHFLAKPCSPEELTAVIERVLALRETLTDEAVLKLAGGMEGLPTIPQLYLMLVEELEKPESSLDRVGAIIERDPGVSASLLKVVNSSFFGFFGEVNSPARAAALLGVEPLKGLVLSASLFEGDAQTARLFPLRRMARHARNVGLIARCIAMTEQKDKQFAEQAFLAGLLHDMGKLLFMRMRGKEYADLIAQANADGASLHDAEKARFGANHAELGAYLLGVWGINPDVATAVGAHHLLETTDDGGPSLPICVHVADAFDQGKSGDPLDGEPSGVDTARLQELGLLEKLAVWRETCLG